MSNIKLSFKNTLWFLVPSVTLFLIIGLPDLYRHFILGAHVYDLKGSLSDSYYLFLLPNIPFFIASYALFVFLRKGLNRMLSVLLSNGLAVGSWFLSLYASQFLIRLGDLGFGALLILAVAILALIVFLVKSILISKYYTPAEIDGMTSEVEKPASNMKTVLNYGLIILIVLSMLLLFIYYVNF